MLMVEGLCGAPEMHTHEGEALRAKGDELHLLRSGGSGLHHKFPRTTGWQNEEQRQDLCLSLTMSK